MRGFTLVELMVVVVIIAVLAVIAVPLFGARMQGRRIMQSAGRLADLYRGSRTRALARGAAVMVKLDFSTKEFTVLEGVQGTNAAAASGSGKTSCGNLPTRGCLTNDWGNVGGGGVIGTARVIEGVLNSSVNNTMTVGTDTTSITSGIVGVCFSPAGRTYLNRTGTWTPESWVALNNVLAIDVISINPATTTPRNYKVLIMPNGTARLAP